MNTWFNRHHYSTWMVVGSLILMGALVHPSLASYLLVAMNVGLMVITREVARLEARPCWPCAIGGGVIIFVAVVMMLKVNWMAI